MVLYQFENDRKYGRTSDYLEDFNGVIQSDGYQVYANIEDGRAEISNNSAERRCKNFVIGKKNFLF